MLAFVKVRRHGQKICYQLPLMTCENNSSGEFPKKGGHPTRNSYKIIPIDHQSTGFPEEKKSTFDNKASIFIWLFIFKFYKFTYLMVQIHIKLSNFVYFAHIYDFKNVLPYPFLRITSGAMYSGVPITCLSLNSVQSCSKEPS